MTRVVEALEELGAAAQTFLHLLATRDVIPALTWVALTLVALLGELPHGVGDEFGWVAVHAPGGQLRGDRERVEQGVKSYGRPESRTTMRCPSRETTSVIVAVQAVAPTVGDADRNAARVLRERGDTGSVEHRAPAVLELAGFPTGEGLSLRRVEVGRQFTVECRRDDPARPGADVHVPFIAKSRQAAAEFGLDADLENVCTSHDMTQ